MQLTHPKNTIGLKTIAISTENYYSLKNMGNAADSFNDMITDLIEKVGILENSINNEKLLQPDQSPRKAQSDCSRPRET
jgi:hypothetical protein